MGGKVMGDVAVGLFGTVLDDWKMARTCSYLLCLHIRVHNEVGE